MAVTPTSGPASADEVAQLKAQVQQLEAKVDTLQNDQAKRNADTAAAIQQVLADADKHTQSFDLEQDFTSGFLHNRFILQSDDGNYVLRPWIHIQIRHTTNWRSDEKVSGGDDTENGFELRRARFGADGNLFSPDFTYDIDWATYRTNQFTNVTTPAGKTVSVNQGNGGLPVLEEAWVQYHFPNTYWYLKGGQEHDPLIHEAIVGSKYRQPEASLMTDIFANTDTFVQAVSLIYDTGKELRVEVAATDGIRSNNTDFTDFPNDGNGYDWGAAGRIEYKFFGDWHDYSQLTALHDKTDLLVAGLGADYSERGSSDEFTHVGDVQYASPSGLFAYAAYLGRYTTNNPGIPSGAPTSTSFGTPAVPGQYTYEPSGQILVAYLIDQHWEPYARYEYLYLKGTPAKSHNEVTDLSLGVNYYFVGHNAKLTVQGMYLPRGIPINDTSSDVLANNGHEEAILITQFQLLL
jgi:outer membrane murein-binding lipoprotein Lpp